MAKPEPASRGSDKLDRDTIESEKKNDRKGQRTLLNLVPFSSKQGLQYCVDSHGIPSG